MIEDSMVERVARAIVRHRIDVAGPDTLEGYGIPYGAQTRPAERDAAEAAAIDQAWPAWRTAARAFIEAMRAPGEARAGVTSESGAAHQRPWQTRVAGHDRRRGDRRQAG